MKTLRITFLSQSLLQSVSEDTNLCSLHAVRQHLSFGCNVMCYSLVSSDDSALVLLHCIDLKSIIVVYVVYVVYVWPEAGVKKRAKERKELSFIRTSQEPVSCQADIQSTCLVCLVDGAEQGRRYKRAAHALLVLLVFLLKRRRRREDDNNKSLTLLSFLDWDITWITITN